MAAGTVPQQKTQPFKPAEDPKGADAAAAAARDAAASKIKCSFCGKEGHNRGKCSDAPSCAECGDKYCPKAVKREGPCFEKGKPTQQEIDALSKTDLYFVNMRRGRKQLQPLAFSAAKKEAMAKRAAAQVQQRALQE